MALRVTDQRPAVQPPSRTARLRMLANSATSLAERLRDLAALDAMGADIHLSLMEVSSLAGRVSDELRRLPPAAESKSR